MIYEIQQDSTLKLRMKFVGTWLGDVEFNGEGPASSISEDCRKFLDVAFRREPIEKPSRLWLPWLNNPHPS